MAAYNNAGFIKAAIDSALAQTYTNWELVILDDGSTDGTYELATALAQQDPRIKLHRNPKNLGYNTTMVAIAKLATGELFAHFDSDDMLERYALEEMVNTFDANPDVMLVYSDFAQVARIGNVKSYVVESYSPSLVFDKDKLYQHGWRHFGMYRSVVFQHIHGYNEKLAATNGCADGDLFMQIVEKFKALRLPKVLYFYRNHGENISKKNNKCETCPVNPDCNYIRVWAKAANRDQRTLQPLNEEQT